MKTSETTNKYGTGNTFIYLGKGAIYQHLPNTTQVTNITKNYLYGGKPEQLQQKRLDDEEKKIRKNAILRYVKRMAELVTDKWKERHDELWLHILETPEVNAQIYDPGKQRGTLFNRNLVGSIIGLLAQKMVYSTRKATQLTMALEGSEKHSIRQAITLPPSQEINNAVLQLLNQ